MELYLSIKPSKRQTFRKNSGPTCIGFSSVTFRKDVYDGANGHEGRKSMTKMTSETCTVRLYNEYSASKLCVSAQVKELLYRIEQGNERSNKTCNITI